MTATQEPKQTPMMAQWSACKEVAKDALLFFRMGDFYEAFYEDASLIAKELDLALTKRQGIPMSGVPHHTCETYIDRLVAKGYRVAVAEQTEDPKKTKGLVKREVVRVVTPGTVIDSSLLSDKSNNFFASLSRVGNVYGLAFLDLTTSEFRVTEFNQEQALLNELYRLRPSEFLTTDKFMEKQGSLLQEMKQTYSFLVNTQDNWHFDHSVTATFLLQHLGVQSLDGFGLRGMVAAINAAGALLAYLSDHLCLPIDHIREVLPYNTAQYMTLDRISQRNLELTENLQDGTKRNTLLSVIDHTHTPMGGRLLRQWIKQPLLAPEAIAKRQDGVEAFFKNPFIMEKLEQLLDPIRDLERLMMKVSTGFASPRDLIALRCSFDPMPEIKALVQTLGPVSEILHIEAERLDGLQDLAQLIGHALVDEPPLRVNDGKVFRDGYCAELDELRTISRDSKTWIAKYQAELREDLEIKSLKVGFNRMFGYYIEVSKGQSDKMPDTFQRRQTLVNAERFISPELKEYENKVLHAEEKIGAIETELFTRLRTEVAQYSYQVQQVAGAIGKIDCLYSLASAARQNDYVRPSVNASNTIEIKEGRHPVIEASTAAERFIPNDTLLDAQSNRLLLITGPNMAGKSTYIRQVALIAILAQMGGFVPAIAASIGTIDKVFTRIGASDDLSRGQSTFMVEMTETANILNNATDRSLVILDEIGRGTSTYDGISIAWSVAEYLLTTEGKQAKTLFATHYWELTKLEEKIPGAVNYNVAVQENAGSVIFLRKIIKGGTDRSYGIHVAQLAGLPREVVDRAKELLIHLEENANRDSAFEPTRPKTRRKKKKVPLVSDQIQLSFFE